MPEWFSLKTFVCSVVALYCFFSKEAKLKCNGNSLGGMFFDRLHFCVSLE